MTNTSLYTIIRLFSKTKQPRFKSGGEEVTAIHHKYTLIKSDAGGRAGVYGITVYMSAGNSVCYPYISENRGDTEQLISRLEGSDISPEHIGDIVRDYITELYFEKLSINGLH